MYTMKEQLLLLMLSIGFYACNGKKTPNVVTVETNGAVTLVDSSAKTENLLVYQPSDREGFYPVYYVGLPMDTIVLGQRQIPKYKFGQKSYNNGTFAWADSTKIKIIVDTAFSLVHTFFHEHYDEEKNKGIIDSTESVKAYAIFVYNTSDSLLSVGHFGELGYTIRQARNEQGEWVDIEIPINYSSGTNARHIVLEPKYILIAKLLRYKGDFKTECRLKFTRWHKTIYSNSFTDYIDKRQLTKILSIDR